MSYLLHYCFFIIGSEECCVRSSRHLFTCVAAAFRAAVYSENMVWNKEVNSVQFEPEEETETLCRALTLWSVRTRETPWGAAASFTASWKVCVRLVRTRAAKGSSNGLKRGSLSFSLKKRSMCQDEQQQVSQLHCNKGRDQEARVSPERTQQTLQAVWKSGTSTAALGS